MCDMWIMSDAAYCNKADNARATQLQTNYIILLKNEADDKKHSVQQCN